MTSAASQSLPNFSDNLLGYESCTFGFQNAGHTDNSQQTGNSDFALKPSFNGNEQKRKAKDDDDLFVEKCKGKFIYTVVIRQKILTKAISCHKMIFVKTYLYVNDSEEDQ
ncbi:MAG: hypothetical protein ACLTDC_04490 [Lachnospiraceae bacterium]